MRGGTHMISVVSCCQREEFRSMVREYIAQHREFHLAEETDKAEIAVPAILGISPNLVICESLRNLEVQQLLHATADYVPDTWFLILGVPQETEALLNLMHSGMRDGLPYPCTEDALWRAMDRVCRHFTRQRNTEAENNMQLRRMLDKRFFEDTIVTDSGSAILGNYPAMDLEYQIAFQDGWFYGLYILLDPRPREMLQADSFLPVMQTEALAREFFSDDCSETVCYVKDHGLSVLMNAAEPIQDCRALCRSFLSECSRRFPWFSGSNTISIGIGLPSTKPQEIPLVVQSAKFAGWMRFSEGMGRVLDYAAHYDCYMDKTAFLSKETRDALLESVRLLDGLRCREYVEQALEGLKNSGEVISQLLSICDILIDAFNSYSETAVVRSSKYLQLAENMPPMIESMDSTLQMKTSVLKWVDERIQQLQGIAENKENNAILTAKQYIGSHYTQTLRLDQVAEIVGLSAPYFSTKFRQCTGKSFVDYVTELRIAKAKALLHSTNRKIHEISNAVGFQDSRHFSRVFKKLCGMLPTEYRESCTGNRK